MFFYDHEEHQKSFQERAGADQQAQRRDHLVPHRGDGSCSVVRHIRGRADFQNPCLLQVQVAGERQSAGVAMDGGAGQVPMQLLLSF